jgi:NADH-quinone oxidoreductase subunit E
MTNARTTLLTIERPGDSSVFGESVRADARQIIARYPAGQSRSALLPMLHLVQAEEGYITPDGIAFCAEQLELTHAQVAAVATFYTMYKRKPTGEYLVSVCTNTLCGMLGGDDIYKTLSETLGVGMNETTADGSITLEHAECLAACDYAPVVTVNYEFYDNQSVASATGLVAELRNGQRPLPTRGAPLCTFRQISRQIAGFVDERREAYEAASAGEPTVVGLRLAAERGERAQDYPTPAGGRNDSGANVSTSGYGGTAGKTSGNDAPLQTAASDPANPAPTAGADNERNSADKDDAAS